MRIMGETTSAFSGPRKSRRNRDDSISEEEKGSDDDSFDEDLIAAHQYQPVPLEQFSMKPLLMKDFACIYESLMIIKWCEDHGKQIPMITMGDWRMYVLLHFNAEEFKTQQLFHDMWIIKCLDFFETKYKISVWLFNVYQHAQEMEKLKLLEEAGIILPDYFLIYWGEHVFPCLRENLVNVYEFQKNIVDNFKSNADKLFMIMPPVLELLHIEMKCSFYNLGSIPNTEGDYLWKELGFSALDIIHAGNVQGKKAYDYSIQKDTLNFMLGERMLGEDAAV